MSDVHYSMTHLHRRLFRVEVDLCNDQGRTFGALVLLKNQAVAPVRYHTLNRIEHLRRPVLNALANIERISGEGDGDEMTGGCRDRAMAGRLQPLRQGY